MEKFSKTVFVGVLSWIVGYFQPIWGVICVFIGFFVADFITGVFASRKKGKKFRSYKARESFFKLLIYLFTFMFVIAIGNELNRLDDADELGRMITILKMLIYVAVWFEAKSNVENLHIIFPKNRFISFLDYVLGVEFVEKITWLKNFIDKENKDNS